jgi:hypothetical protein
MPAENLLPPILRAKPTLRKNTTSHSWASSMHLTQRIDQASAVGWLLGELTGQSIQKILTSNLHGSSATTSIPRSDSASASETSRL